MFRNFGFGHNYGFSSGYSSGFGAGLGGSRYDSYEDLYYSGSEDGASGDSGDEGDGWWPDFLSGTKEAAKDSADEVGKSVVKAGIAALYKELGITGGSSISGGSSGGASADSSDGSSSTRGRMQTVVYALGGALGLLLIVELLTAK